MKTMILALSLFALPVLANTDATQPPVARAVLICDQWQWIGNGNITWGCVTQPRQVALAEGRITDQVIQSLQKQLNELQAQLVQLKKTEQR